MHSPQTFSSLSLLRPCRASLDPLLANSRAVPAPIPELAPGEEEEEEEEEEEGYQYDVTNTTTVTTV